MDDWVLVDLVPGAAAGARGFYTGTVHDREGRLRATIAQEHVMREGEFGSIHHASPTNMRRLTGITLQGPELRDRGCGRAAVGEDLRAVDVARHVAGQEHAHTGDVLGLTIRRIGLLCLTVSIVPSPHALVMSVSNGPGSTVLARPSGCSFGEAQGHGVEPRLRHRVRADRARRAATSRRSTR